VLVGSEIALSVVLLLGATLLLQSLVHLTGVDPGFDPHHVLTFEISAPVTQGAGLDTFLSEITARIHSLAGVSSVSAAASLPLMGDSVRSSVEIEGQPTPMGSRPAAGFNAVEPGYFSDDRRSSHSGQGLHRA
jgi:putative ABC transport system permease protein